MNTLRIEVRQLSEDANDIGDVRSGGQMAVRLTTPPGTTSVPAP